ncbi:MAG TPA: HEPN domain-containing protein [Spirochaetota bacterium]|nr:HEPN domain-containing protein [Spirochaetota bacterium]HQO41268.1 HEPN domain-containing protein [Spirochaetota bacterium]
MDDNSVIIRNCLEKARRSLTSASDSINNNDIDNAINRIYYSIFYSAMALGYKHGFVTSKHGQLIGWFNKFFIHENRIFPEKMFQVYKTAFDNRQENDYNIVVLDSIAKDEARRTLIDAEDFVNRVSGYLSEYTGQ